MSSDTRCRQTASAASKIGRTLCDLEHTKLVQHTGTLHCYNQVVYLQAKRMGARMRTLFSVSAWLVLALLSHVGAAASQQEGRIYRIGYLWIGTPGHVPTPVEKWTGSFAKTRDTLADHGFKAGKNAPRRHTACPRRRGQASCRSKVSRHVRCRSHLHRWDTADCRGDAGHIAHTNCFSSSGKPC